MCTKFANNYHVMKNFVYGLSLVVRLMNLPDLYSYTTSRLYRFKKIAIHFLVIRSYNFPSEQTPNTREQVWSRDKQEVHAGNMFGITCNILLASRKLRDE